MSQPLKAIVRSGRIIMDEPTDLAEGTELRLVIVEELVDFAEPWMDADEAQAFREEVQASMADFDAGHVITGDALIAELRAQHSS